MIQKITAIIKTVDKTIEEYVLHFVDQIEKLHDNEQSA